ncbi:MAG: hypothetical protein JW841_17930 [Deltaproteobacteria bacterium]|nr:hypothetical protein [Deltaproteobacteria bacterium]
MASVQSSSSAHDAIFRQMGVYNFAFPSTPPGLAKTKDSTDHPYPWSTDYIAIDLNNLPSYENEYIQAIYSTLINNKYNKYAKFEDIVTTTEARNAIITNAKKAPDIEIVLTCCQSYSLLWNNSLAIFLCGKLSEDVLPGTGAINNNRVAASFIAWADVELWWRHWASYNKNNDGQVPDWKEKYQETWAEKLEEIPDFWQDVLDAEDNSDEEVKRFDKLKKASELFGSLIMALVEYPESEELLSALDAFCKKQSYAVRYGVNLAEEETKEDNIKVMEDIRAACKIENKQERLDALSRIAFHTNANFDITDLCEEMETKLGELDDIRKEEDVTAQRHAKEYINPAIVKKLSIQESSASVGVCLSSRNFEGRNTTTSKNVNFYNALGRRQSINDHRNASNIFIKVENPRFKHNTKTTH